MSTFLLRISIFVRNVIDCQKVVLLPCKTSSKNETRSNFIVICVSKGHIPTVQAINLLPTSLTLTLPLMDPGTVVLICIGVVFGLVLLCGLGKCIVSKWSGDASLPARNVTVEGSFSAPIRNASADDSLRGDSFCETHPPRPCDFPTFPARDTMRHPSAWRFQSSNANAVIHQDRVQFYPLKSALQPAQDCSIQTGLPIPWFPDMHRTAGQPGPVMSYTMSSQLRPILYFEITILEMHPRAIIAVGLARGPYPGFRLPGWHHWSVGYHSDDGRLYLCDDEDGIAFHRPYREGDVVGVGIETKTGAVFFTRNGTRLPELASLKLKGDQVHLSKLPCPEIAIWPTLGADGPCVVECNFGDIGEFKWADAQLNGWGYCVNESINCNVN
jgi:hypothetical protein